MTEAVSKVTEFDLRQFTGTESYQRVDIRGLYLASDGVAYVFRQCRCYWLGDVISSHARKFLRTDFVVWFVRADGGGVIVSAEDGNGGVLHLQKVDYSDLGQYYDLSKPLKIYQQATGDGRATLILPSEY